jgi:hypothetical protein
MVTLPNFKSYCKVILVNKVWCEHRINR